MKRGMKRKFDHEAIRAAYESGKTMREVAEQFGCSTYTVSYVMSGRASRRPARGTRFGFEEPPIEGLSREVSEWLRDLGTEWEFADPVTAAERDAIAKWATEALLEVRFSGSRIYARKMEEK